jgi:outer membrane cobalamin receptor
MKKKYLLLTITVLIFVVVSKSQNLEKDTIKLEEVEIQGEKLAPKYVNLLTTNHFLTKEQLNLVQPENLMDRLVFLPGVLAVSNSFGGLGFAIRGQETNRVNVFFNGIPVRSNTENIVPVDNFLIANSDIFLEKGSSSLIYGANSGGSVIRFDNRMNFKEKAGVYLNTFWGNNGKQNYNLSLTGKVAEKFKYLLSANYFKRNSFRLSEEFDTLSVQKSRNRNNSDKKNMELLGIISYKFNQNHLISLTGMYNDGVYGLPPSIVKARFRRMTQFENTLVGLRTVSSFKNDLKLESNLYYTALSDTLTDFTNDTYTTLRKYSHWVDETIGMRLIVSKSIDSLHTINFSFDTKLDIHNQNWNYIIATTKVNTLLTALEYKTVILKKLNLNAGISYDYVNPFYTSIGQIPVEYLSALNYQLSFAYVPQSYLYKIHLGYNRTTIFPSMRNFYNADINPGYIPNPDLKEEKNGNFDLGINSSFMKNKLNSSISIFYNPIKNLIVDVQVSDTTSQSQNVNSAKFYGLEIMQKYAPSKKIFTYLSYTFLKARNTSFTRTSDHLAYRPEHQVKSFISYIPRQFLGVNISFTYVSKQFYDNITQWASIPGYITTDIGMESKWLNFVTFWFKVNNVFDKNYFATFDQPQPGREFRFGLTLDIKASDN